MTAQPTVLVGCTNKIVWVRVEGKGTFQNSAGLKQFCDEMINRGHREFVVDLRNCPVMDSTFMGTLAGIALRLRRLGQGNLHVINLNERNSDLLANLGLDHLFAIDMSSLDQEQPASEEALPARGNHSASTQTILDAHEALVEAAPENETKFKDVLEYLKQDLHLSR